MSDTSQEAPVASARDLLIARMVERIAIFVSLFGYDKKLAEAQQADNRVRPFGGPIQQTLLVREAYEDLYTIFGGETGLPWFFVSIHNGEEVYVYARKFDDDGRNPGLLHEREVSWGFDDPENLHHPADDLLELFELEGTLPTLDWDDESMLEALLESSWRYEVSRPGLIGQTGIDRISRFVRERGGNAQQVNRMVGRISLMLGAENG